MSNKFYLKDIAIKNFRSFGDIEIKKLHRINVIGGLNAAGKSALLETLFLVLDRRSPAALLKPLLWRMPNEPLVFDPRFIFLRSIQQSGFRPSQAQRRHRCIVD
jgi:hypothetical protein